MAKKCCGKWKKKGKYCSKCPLLKIAGKDKHDSKSVKKAKKKDKDKKKKKKNK